MKIALAQQNYLVGDIKHNADKIIQAIELAQQQQSDVVVFSELSLSGYPPHDDFWDTTFFNLIEYHLDRICKACKQITAIVGTPRQENNKMYNAAIVIHNAQIIATIDKTLLPEYDVFNECRYFTSATKWQSLRLHNKTIAISICEDIWFDEKRYLINPLEQVAAQGKIDYIFNLSASPYHRHHYAKRVQVLRNNALRYQAPLYYVNTIGAQTDLIFDGRSLMMDAKGEIVACAKAFEEDLLIIDDTNVSIPTIHSVVESETDYQALMLGIKDYCVKTGFQKVIVGASGGIDSAVVQALASLALGKENVIAVLMPSKFSSDHSLHDAQQLSENIGNPYHIIPIHQEYEIFLQSLKPLFQESPFGLAEENLQSRIRGNLLMTIANKYNYILLNTSNKSELAMGYGTLYGDMAGALSVLGDVWKTQVYELAKIINTHHPHLIPQHIFTKAPSAELRPNQKDADSLPEYAILDRILQDAIVQQLSCEEIVARHAIEKSLVEQTLRTYRFNEYKRFQFCPILRIQEKAFGRGRKIEVVKNK